MNIYTQQFTAKCAKNDRRIQYRLVIESSATIMVEDIQAEVGKLTAGYHEDFADKLFQRFGGRQVIDADHHGTHVQTVRP